MRRIATMAAMATVLALQAWPSPAAATFHEMWIREVYAGSSAQPGSEYVELQMWAPGQNFVAGHVVKTYDENGTVTSTKAFTAKVPNGANQSTVLLATPAAEAEFGVVADTDLGGGGLEPEGGAVCWDVLDCVSWGSFSGSGLSSPTGSPAVAMPDGMALRRTIAPLCPTALDGGDDHNNSALDFSPVFPAPRPNSVPPSELLCLGGNGGGTAGTGGEGKRGAPRTMLRRKPGKKIYDRTPTFRFASSEAGSSFQCKLDGKPFRRCRSPFTTRRLAFGPHTFKVRAHDDSGRRDPSPAAYSFRVVPRP